MTKFGRHLMATKKFSRQYMACYDFGHHRWIKSIFSCCLDIVRWRSNFCSSVLWWPIFQEVFEGIWIFKCNSWFILEHQVFFHLGSIYLVAHLQPLRGTLGEGQPFLHFVKILEHIKPWYFETLIFINN